MEKSIKRLLNKYAAEERAGMTAEKLFKSNNFFMKMQALVNSLTEGIPLELRMWGDFTAYTNHSKIVVNTNNKIVKRYTLLPMKFFAICGIIFHEVAHILYLDKRTELRAVECILTEGKLYGDIPRTMNKEFKDFLKESPAMRKLIAGEYHHLANIISDPHDENLMKKYHGGENGFIAYCIETAVNGMKNTCASLDELLERDIKKLDVLHDIMLQYARFGEVYILDLEEMKDTEEYIILKRMMPYIDGARNTNSPIKKNNNLNEILVLLYPVIKEYLKDSKEPSKSTESESSDESSGSSKSSDEEPTSSDDMEEETKSKSSDDPSESESETGSGSSEPTESEKAESSDEDAEDESSDESSESTEGSDEELASSDDGLEEDAEDESSDESSGSTESSEELSEEEIEKAAEEILKALEEAAKKVSPSESPMDADPSDTAKKISEKGDDEEETGDAKDEEAAKKAADDIFESIMDSIAKEDAEEKLEEEIEKDESSGLLAAEISRTHKGIPISYEPAKEVIGADVTDYEKIYESIEVYIKKSIRLFKRLIKDVQDGDLKTGFLYGNTFIANHAYRSDQKFWGRKTNPQDFPDLSVMLLVDQSGSMHGERIESARKAAITLYEFCRSLDIPISIIGHDMVDSMGSVTGEKMRLVKYIGFDKIKADEKYRLAKMFAGYNNRDGMALELAGSILLKRPEENKLMIYISDGQPAASCYYGPSANEDTQKSANKLKEKGIKLICFAIGSDKENIRKIYGDESFIDIENLETFPKALVDFLKKFLVSKI